MSPVHVNGDNNGDNIDEENNDDGDDQVLIGAHHLSLVKWGQHPLLDLRRVNTWNRQVDLSIVRIIDLSCFYQYI